MQIPRNRKQNEVVRGYGEENGEFVLNGDSSSLGR